MADPGFSKEGCQPSGSAAGIDFIKFSEKLHEIENNSVAKGAPPRSATADYNFVCSFQTGGLPQHMFTVLSVCLFQTGRLPQHMFTAAHLGAVRLPGHRARQTVLRALPAVRLRAGHRRLHLPRETQPHALSVRAQHDVTSGMSGLPREVLHGPALYAGGENVAPAK